MSALKFLYDVRFRRSGAHAPRPYGQSGRRSPWRSPSERPAIAPAHEGREPPGAGQRRGLKDAATESRLADATVARSAADAQAAAAAVVGNEGEVGQWGPVVDWPVVGIHVALLTNGKVVAWDASNLDDQSYTKTDGPHLHACDGVRPGDGHADGGVGQRP